MCVLHDHPDVDYFPITVCLKVCDSVQGSTDQSESRILTALWYKLNDRLSCFPVNTLMLVVELVT